MKIVLQISHGALATDIAVCKAATIEAVDFTTVEAVERKQYFYNGKLVHFDDVSFDENTVLHQFLYIDDDVLENISELNMNTEYTGYTGAGYYHVVTIFEELNDGYTDAVCTKCDSAEHAFTVFEAILRSAE